MKNENYKCTWTWYWINTGEIVTKVGECDGEFGNEIVVKIKNETASIPENEFKTRFEKA